MKLTVLGGGGVRSAFLAKSLAYNAHRIGLQEVVFLDNAEENLKIFGEIAVMFLPRFDLIFVSA